MCWLERETGSNGDPIQTEHLGVVSKQLRAKINDGAGYCVEVSDLVGLEPMEELAQALDEAALLLAAVVVGIAKFQEYLVI